MRDVVLHLPRWLSNGNSSSLQKPKKLTIIYFLTGNPGLIAYYEQFLKLLAEGSGENAVIAGASLGGFESRKAWNPDNPDTSLEDNCLHPSPFRRPQIFNLQDQIHLSRLRLVVLIRRLRNNHVAIDNLPTEVILIGHSVGAYIALELVRHHHELHISNTVPVDSEFAVISTILLTPTIQEIAQSSSGKIATPLLSSLPFFPALLQLGAGSLTSTLPVSWLRDLVMRLTGMKDHHAIDTTLSFLRTPGAVKQALHMARHEMAEIGADKWSEEIWGAAEAQTKTLKESGESAVQGSRRLWKAPMHYFLFAKEDHWVADTTREAIVKAMGGRATILVDDGAMGLVHAWCLEQSRLVARVVNGWLEEVAAASST